MPLTLDDAIWPIRSQRLTIRRAVPGDAGAAWAYRRLPEVNEWMTSAITDEAAYAEAFADPDRLAKTLIIEEYGRIVGDLMIAVEDAWAQQEVEDIARGSQAEVGWCLDPSHQGRGLATEAVTASIDLCFGALELRRVYANCFADNERSWRLMERLGMRREAHHVADSLHRSRIWLDGYVYALLDSEWRRA